MWPLSFDRAPAPFTTDDFDEDAPTVTVFGNLVDATQGKAEREAVLGNGDARQVFQTFPLPKSPLTYFLVERRRRRRSSPSWRSGSTAACGRASMRFFGRGPKDEVYIVREDAEGRSFVQFGDGETGARLPSGLEERRRASTAAASARAGRSSRAPRPRRRERPIGFDKVSLAGIVSGGADPEDLRARRARPRPARCRASAASSACRDYETETLADPRRRRGQRRLGPARRRAGGDAARAARGRPRGRVRRRARRDRPCAALPRARTASRDRAAGAAALRLPRRDAMRAIRATRSRRSMPALRAALGLAGDDGERAQRPVRPARAAARRARVREPHRGPRCRTSPACCGARSPRSAGSPPACTDPATLVLPAPPRAARHACPARAHELLQLDARAPHADRGRPSRRRENAHEHAHASRCSIACRRSTASATRSSRRRTSCAPTSPRSRRRSARCTTTSGSSTTTCSSTPATTGSFPTSPICSARRT